MVSAGRLGWEYDINGLVLRLGGSEEKSIC